MTSPEILIFLFFMITDPKTVPTGRRGRIAFGFLVAVASTLLMAPQTTEFGTKVALLGGLAVVCAGRPIADRLLSARFARPVDGGVPATDRRVSGAPALLLRGALFLALVAVLGTAIVAAGAPARGVVTATADTLDRVPHQVDPATFPAITVEQDVLDWNHEITGAGAREIVLTLAENLGLENEALLRGDPTILTAVDHGDRLDEMQARLSQGTASGATVVDRYQIDDINVSLLVPFGKQDGLSLGLQSRGTVTKEMYDGDGHVSARETAPFATTFVVRRATGGRWLNVAALPYGAGT
jgi:hypothetical protein